jgi:hypothetical protein
MEYDLNKEMEDDLNFFLNGRRPKKMKWMMTNQSTKINLISCETIVNSPSFSWYSIGIGIVLELLFFLCVLYWYWSQKVSIVHLYCSGGEWNCSCHQLYFLAVKVFEIFWGYLLCKGETIVLRLVNFCGLAIYDYAESF